MFLNKFRKIYEIAFLERKIEIKPKYFFSLLYTRLEQIFKEKETSLLNANSVFVFVKSSNDKNKEACKMYRNLFEKLKLLPEKHYFQNKLKQYENNIKGTWKIVKVIIGKYRKR